MNESYPKVPEVKCWCSGELSSVLCSKCEAAQLHFTKQYADLLSYKQSNKSEGVS